MSFTEIHIFRAGEKTAEIRKISRARSKKQAEEDAKQRIARDATVQKILYYKPNDLNQVRVFHLEVNPSAKTSTQLAAGRQRKEYVQARRKPTPAFQAPETMGQKLKKMLGLND